MVSGFWFSKCVLWHACCTYFGILGDLWAILGHFGAQERRRRDPGLDLCRVRMDFGTTFKKCLANFGTTYLIFSCVFTGQCFFWFRCLNLDVWGSRVRHFVWAVLQAPTFHIYIYKYIGILLILVSYSYVFQWLWGQFWWLVVPWRHAWNWIISMAFLGEPGAEHRWPVDGIIFLAPWALLQ